MLAQSRLVDVIRDLPDEEGAEWFEEHWTGEQKGRSVYCRMQHSLGGKLRLTSAALFQHLLTT